MATPSWSAVAELAAAQHGVISTSQAALLGFDRDRLRAMRRRGVIDAAARGVLRVTAVPVTWRQRVMTACLATGGVASGRTAAGLHGLDGFSPSGSVEVTVVRGTRSVVPGVRIRSSTLEQRDVTRANGIPVTSLARTLCDLGASCESDLVERALDDALRRGCSQRWIRETLSRLERPGPSGTGVLRRVLDAPHRRPGVPESWRERITARLLDHPELQPLAVQFELRDGARVIARPDMAVLDAQVGIEYHSDQWHYGPRRGRGDRRRDLLAAGIGWELVYLDASDHRRPADALHAVPTVVRIRRRQLGIA